MIAHPGKGGMEISSLIGFAAGVCTTGSLLPQVIKTLKTKNTRDISLYMYILLNLGIFLWFIYGVLLREMPIMVANGVSLLLAMIVLVLKLKHG